jgi:DNA modification methylase
MANVTAKFGNKTHTQVLPTHLDIPIKEQFGFFPTSVIKPTNESKKKWKDVAYFNDGEVDVRKTSSGNDASGVQKMSEFHAGLCENIIKYWSMNGSKIVDPFAGRVTRAAVSSILGREYYGYEITPNTYKRALEHFNKHNINPTLYNGDGTLLSETPNEFADLVMTCPPYFNIEKYESCDGQLSDINDYSKFMEMMNTTIENCFSLIPSSGITKVPRGASTMKSKTTQNCSKAMVIATKTWYLVNFVETSDMYDCINNEIQKYTF